MTIKLSDSPEGGKVSLCRRCDDVHIHWKRLMLSLPAEEFRALCRMLEEAARAFSRNENPDGSGTKLCQ